MPRIQPIGLHADLLTISGPSDRLPARPLVWKGNDDESDTNSPLNFPAFQAGLPAYVRYRRGDHVSHPIKRPLVLPIAYDPFEEEARRLEI